MRKKLLVGLSISLIIVFAIFSGGCMLFGGEEETPAPTTTPGVLVSISELENDLAALETRVKNLEDTNVTVDTTTLQDDLAQLQNEFDALVESIATQEATIAQLSATVTALQNRIAALETEVSEEIETTTTARWYPEIYNLNHLNLLPDGVTPEVSIDYSLNPSRVQEADDYKIYLDIYNNTTTAINDLQIEVNFTPKTGSSVIVDEDEIFLDTTVSPYYAWDTDIVTRSDGTCRRITFFADLVKIPRGIVVDSVFTPGLTSLKLVFTLAYK